MIKTLNFSDFVDEWNKWDDRKNTFSYDGKKALWDYLEQYAEDEGTPIELDIIALCCDYTEYATAWDAMEVYQPEDMPTMGEDGDDLIEIQAKNEIEARKWLDDHTTVIDLENGGVIISNF